jgi:hypothetical protein
MDEMQRMDFERLVQTQERARVRSDRESNGDFVRHVGFND